MSSKMAVQSKPHRAVKEQHTLVDLFHSIDVHVQHASNIHVEFKQQKRSGKDGKSPCRYRH